MAYYPHTGHHYDKGFKRGLQGLGPDKRKRVGDHKTAYAEGYTLGRKLFLKAVAHGTQQKIADYLARDPLDDLLQ